MPEAAVTPHEDEDRREVPVVFVAHRKDDVGVARHIADGLHERGIHAWFDDYEIVAGDDFVARMEQGLAAAHGGVVVLSSAGLAGSWTYAEYTALLQRTVTFRGEGQRPFLIPVLTLNCSVSW